MTKIRPSMVQLKNFGCWPRAYGIEIYKMKSSKVVVLNDSLEWIDSGGTHCIVPAGFVSDGATLPSFAWWLLGGKLSLDWISSAIVHDFSCVVKPAWARTNTIAAVRFYRGLRADGMSWWKARLAYYAVKTFGPKWDLTCKQMGVK